MMNIQLTDTQKGRSVIHKNYEKFAEIVLYRLHDPPSRLITRRLFKAVFLQLNLQFYERSWPANASFNPLISNDGVVWKERTRKD